MEIVKIKKFLTVETGYGSGDGSGFGDGSGDGSGFGDGDGSGDGSGYGSGYGSGDGSGFGDGSGCGSGYGYGDGSGFGDGSGYGDGSGDGSGDGVQMFCGQIVHMVDGVATIVKAVFGDFAKGYILKRDLTLEPCYIAKRGVHFAHGETLAEAVQDAINKQFEDMDEDERIEAFLECHEKGVKYPARDLYEWHNKLTGSCEMGRKTFAQEHGVNIEADMYTVEEFVGMCGNSYGGDIIRRLLE